MTEQEPSLVSDDSQYSDSEDELSRLGSTSHFKKKLSFDSKPIVNLVTLEKKRKKGSLTVIQSLRKKKWML